MCFIRRRHLFITPLRRAEKGTFVVGDVSVPTFNSHEQKLVTQEGGGSARASEIAISPSVNHLCNDTEKQNALGPFHSLREILPPIHTDQSLPLMSSV